MRRRNRVGRSLVWTGFLLGVLISWGACGQNAAAGNGEAAEQAPAAERSSVAPPQNPGESAVAPGIPAESSASEEPPSVTLSESELLRKAQEIVAAHAPDRSIRVRGFRNGLRVIGVSLKDSTASPIPAPNAKTDPGVSHAETDVSLPEWLEPEALLGIASTAHPFDLRLLWKVEPMVNASDETNEFSLKLVHHDGYLDSPQQNERSRLNPSEKAFGAVFWTRHSFEALTNSAPGLYDVYVSGTALPVETIPLGQVLVKGRLEPNPATAAQVQALSPGATCVFGGNAVLTKWFRYRFPVNSGGKPFRTLVVASSADWLEEQADLLEVAMLTLEYPSGKKEQHPLLLGRDTASTWYNLHARSGIKHGLAPVAWSTPARRETLDFDANVYRATFNLTGVREAPSAIEVAYSAPNGILRLRGLLLVP